MLHFSNNLNNFTLFYNIFLENQSFLLEKLRNCETGANTPKLALAKELRCQKARIARANRKAKKIKKLKSAKDTKKFLARRENENYGCLIGCRSLGPSQY